MNRIKYLDGVRGIACMMVILDHFLFCFYPTTIEGNPSSAHNHLELIMAKTPLNVVYNGDLAVCIFFVLSGFVLSIPFFKTNDRQNFLARSAIKRYPRLIIPTFASCLLAYGIMQLGWMFNQSAGQLSMSAFLKSYYNFQPSMANVINQSFYSIFFNNQRAIYNPVLWTMKIELFGSLLIFAVLAIIGSAKRRWYLYIALVVAFFNTYYLAFLAGLIFSDIVHNKTELLNSLHKWYAKYPLLIVGLYFGSFPVISMPNNPGSPWYDFLKIGFLNFNWYSLYHCIAASMLILFILGSLKLQAIMELRPVQWLGKVSFSLYLVHFPIIFSLASFVFIHIIPFVKYDVAFLITFSVSLVAIGALSALMDKYVDKPAIKFAKFVTALLIGEREQRVQSPKRAVNG